MAVVTIKSTRISNAESLPFQQDATFVNHGRVRRAVARIETNADDSIGSIYRFLRLHSSWSVRAITMYCDAITSGAGDVGLYRMASEGGTVVDVDAYASAVSIASAITTGTNIAFEARNIDKAQNQVWQDAGLSADPNTSYELAMTLTAATTAAGTIVVDVEYVVD